VWSLRLGVESPSEDREVVSFDGDLRNWNRCLELLELKGFLIRIAVR